MGGDGTGAGQVTGPQLALHHHCGRCYCYLGPTGAVKRQAELLAFRCVYFLLFLPTVVSPALKQNQERNNCMPQSSKKVPRKSNLEPPVWLTTYPIWPCLPRSLEPNFKLSRTHHITHVANKLHFSFVFILLFCLHSWYVYCCKPIPNPFLEWSRE